MTELYCPDRYKPNAEKMLGELPTGIIAAEAVYYGPDTSVFINDSSTIDSFMFLAGLIPPSSIATSRQIEIWEAGFLTKRLAGLLAGADLSNSYIFPVPGCGENVAQLLANCLLDNYGIDLTVSRTSMPNQKAVIADDVFKTGATALEATRAAGINLKDSIFAAWAMSAISARNVKAASPLAQILSTTQIFTGVVYAGYGVAQGGLPVNSISTLEPLTQEPSKTDELARQKAEAVVEALAQKYFGERIYYALGLK